VLAVVLNEVFENGFVLKIVEGEFMRILGNLQKKVRLSYAPTEIMLKLTRCVGNEYILLIG
jgi:hypothetical protein